MEDKHKKWYLREISRMLFRDGDLLDLFGHEVDGLSLRQEYGDEGFDEVFNEFQEKVLGLFEYETWERFKGIPKEIKTTEQLTGHDVSGT